MFSYQDLSEARYSGHVEHYESVTETRSFSKVAPPPPERSFSQSRGQQYGHHDLHTRERALASAEREGSTSRELSMEKESRSGHHPDCENNHHHHPFADRNTGARASGRTGTRITRGGGVRSGRCPSTPARGDSVWTGS